MGTALAEKPRLLIFNQATDNPVVGTEVVIFVNPTTTYESSREAHIFLKPTLKLNGVVTVEPYAFLKTSNKQWAFWGGPLSQSGTYSLKVDFYLEDFKADEIRTDIANIENRIQELTELIKVETDPVKKQQLIDEKKLKKQMKQDLQNVLTQIRIKIGYEEFDFEVTEL
jgi:hypothetical protein